MDCVINFKSGGAMELNRDTFNMATIFPDGKYKILSELELLDQRILSHGYRDWTWSGDVIHAHLTIFSFSDLYLLDDVSKYKKMKTHVFMDSIDDALYAQAVLRHDLYNPYSLQSRGITGIVFKAETVARYIKGLLHHTQFEFEGKKLVAMHINNDFYNSEKTYNEFLYFEYALRFFLLGLFTRLESGVVGILENMKTKMKYKAVGHESNIMLVSRSNVINVSQYSRFPLHEQDASIYKFLTGAEKDIDYNALQNRF